MQSLPFTSSDAMALSDRAWEIIDPEGLHEADERAWSEELAAEFMDGGHCDTLGDMRSRLDAVSARAAGAMRAVPPAAISVLMVFLVEHPERHEFGEALLADAIRDGSIAGEMGEDLIAWLSEYREVPAAAHRHHLMPEELRHIGPRPRRREDGPQ